MIKDVIIKLVNKQDISYQETYEVISQIISGKSTMVQNAAFLTALSTKNTKSETIEEILGAALAVRDNALEIKHDMEVLDIVGTGGDNSGSFNISTTSAIVLAAGGIKVAKHGNRAASSKCGTADCLEALGININLSPEKCKTLLEKIGICFIFAQNYHESMKNVAQVRKELGFRTIFNVIGPLANPSKPSIQFLGVYDESLVEPMAKVLASLGVERGMVVYGHDKLDEISISSETTICEFAGMQINKYLIKPEDFGLRRYKKEDIFGGNPKENADILKSILEGEQGARRDIVSINAGACFYSAGKVESISNGISLANQIIDSGLALKKLEEFRKMSNE